LTSEEYAREVILDASWRRFGLPTEGRILDVGCGGGWASTALREVGLDVVGLDLEPAGEVTVTGNALLLPFRDRSFDGVLCLRTLPHIPDHQTVLTELCRVLRPQGFILLAVTNHWTYTLIAARATARDSHALWQATKSEAYYHLYTRRELNKMLTSTGFNVVELRGCHFLPTRLARGANKTLVDLFSGIEDKVGKSSFAVPFGTIIIAYGRRA